MIERSNSDNTYGFIEMFNKTLELEKWKDPGKMSFFGLNYKKFDDYSINNYADDKLENLKEHELNRIRRKIHNYKESFYEETLFPASNISLG